MNQSIVQHLQESLGGIWRYDRRLKQWSELSSAALATGCRSRRYVVREAQGLTLYDSARPELPGRVI